MIRATLLGILAITANFADAGILPPANSAICAANLLIAREDSVSGGVAQARAMFSDLNRRWGIQEEQEGGAPLSFRALQLDSRKLKDGDPRLVALGRQLTDLESSLKLMELDHEGSPFNFITGYTVRGSQALSQYSDKVKRLADVLSTLRVPSDGRSQLRLGLYFLMVAIRAFGAYFDVIGTATDFTQLASGKLPDLFQFLSGAVWGAFFTETTARTLLDRDWLLDTRLKASEKFGTEKTNTRNWRYRSYSHRLPRHWVSHLNSDDVTQETVLIMRATDGETDVGRFLERKIFKFNEEYDWVYVDELLSRDPVTQEPVLSVIVRASTDKDRPRPPKRKKPLTELERKLVTDDGWKL